MVTIPHAVKFVKVVTLITSHTMKIIVGGICYPEIDLGSHIQHDVLQAYKN